MKKIILSNNTANKNSFYHDSLKKVWTTNYFWKMISQKKSLLSNTGNKNSFYHDSSYSLMDSFKKNTNMQIKNKNGVFILVYFILQPYIKVSNLGR